MYVFHIQHSYKSNTSASANQRCIPLSFFSLYTTSRIREGSRPKIFQKLEQPVFHGHKTQERKTNEPKRFHPLGIQDFPISQGKTISSTGHGNTHLTSCVQHLASSSHLPRPGQKRHGRTQLTARAGRKPPISPFPQTWKFTTGPRSRQEKPSTSLLEKYWMMGKYKLCSQRPSTYTFSLFQIFHMNAWTSGAAWEDGRFDAEDVIDRQVGTCAQPSRPL